ncbi:helix-turn-helix domain-containing protein [Tabrizicola sp.]|uniref:helix-turn-helix domain-containing protein n=1 Tax=Tabrizicola sp. TaxID=2005166 RepID=UPI003F394326
MDDRRIRLAVEFINDYLAEDISLIEPAEEAAMSAFNFARAFKAATGQSPLQYVIGARIDLAKLLLRTMRLSLSLIALHIGYNDVSRFGQHFRTRVGVTPAAFRAH